MRNSKEDVLAQVVVETLAEALDEDRIQSNIHQRIEQAAAAYDVSHTPIYTQRAFLEVVGNFVLVVYRDGLAVPQHLSRDQARAEALQLLELGYVGRKASGYHTALLDGLNPDVGGIALVLATLGEIIKARERTKYVAWVLASAVDPMDWHAKYQVAKFLLDRLHAFCPPGIAECPPEQMADLYPVLLADHLQTNRALQNFLCNSGMAGFTR